MEKLIFKMPIWYVVNIGHIIYIDIFDPSVIHVMAEPASQLSRDNGVFLAADERWIPGCFTLVNQLEWTVLNIRRVDWLTDCFTRSSSTTKQTPWQTWSRDGMSRTGWPRQWKTWKYQGIWLPSEKCQKKICEGELTSHFWWSTIAVA